MSRRRLGRAHRSTTRSASLVCSVRITVESAARLATRTIIPPTRHQSSREYVRAIAASPRRTLRCRGRRSERSETSRTRDPTRDPVEDDRRGPILGVGQVQPRCPHPDDVLARREGPDVVAHDVQVGIRGSRVSAYRVGLHQLRGPRTADVDINRVGRINRRAEILRRVAATENDSVVPANPSHETGVDVGLDVIGPCP